MVRHVPDHDDAGVRPEITGLKPRDVDLVACVLSRCLMTVVASGRPRGTRDLTGHSARALLTVLRELDALDPRAPGPTGLPARTARSALRAAGRSLDDLPETWTRRTAEHRWQARLDWDDLLLVYPVAAWPVVWRLVTDGPAGAADRLEAALEQIARRRVPPTRARPDGGLTSMATVRINDVAGRRLMSQLVLLHHREHPHPALRSWTAVVKPQLPEGDDAHTDRAAPSLQRVRHGLQTLRADVQARLDAPDGDGLAAVLALPRPRLLQSGLFSPLRNLVLLVLFAVTGARCDALRRLDRRDYRPQHRSPDGRVGPAIVLRPGKTISPLLTRVKPIPPEVAAILDTYLAVVDAHHPEGLGQDTPLLVARLKTAGRYAETSLCRRFCGCRPTARRSGSRALLAKDPDDPWIGYSPHCFRHFAEQTVKFGAPAHLARIGGAAVTGQAVADALIDHGAVEDDAYGYSDVRTQQGRERWSGHGTQIIWDLIATDAGARTTRDVEAYRGALRLREALAGELASIDRRLDAHQSVLLRAADDLRTGAADVAGEILTMHVHQMALTREHRQVNMQLIEAENEVRALREDPARRVVVDDAVPAPTNDEELFAAAERDVLGGRPPAGTPSARVRNWCTVPELAEIEGVAPSTTREWVRGRHLPFPPGDPRRPWDPDDVPVDRRLGERKTRVLIDRVREGFWTDDAKRRRRDLVLSDWPLTGRWPHDAVVE